MNPPVYLHIGQPKSATTSIQSFMNRNRAALDARGILYPLAGLQHTAHHPFAGACSRQPINWIVPMDPADMIARLKAEIAPRRHRAVVLSSEAFYYGTVEPALVRKLFDGFDLRIMVALRRQDEWFESAVRDNIRTGFFKRQPWPANVNDLMPAMRYADVLGRWAEVFGKQNIMVSVFEPKSGMQPVEKSFLAQIGETDFSGYEIGPRANERLSQDCLSWLQHGPNEQRISAEHFKVLRLLALYSRENPDPPELKYLVPPQVRRDILDAVAEQNEIVAREYLGNQDGVLFDTAPPNDVWVKYPGLHPKAAAAIDNFVARGITRKF
ncbi:hypothetical protein [Phaeovulum vinaykumarii]|uniref:Sulfotransferase family protein n=1 Tax=Phaeovulum vinaykumarii TaxID=407234 RepID=A0A1N7M7D0_9RHOB|nr:hypothetical protein [Phaeovulum vinaykumarii]SIS81899.1 hypothetical protein SAMN05421795_1063 [Phaeovulum vinaykumarii]SOC11307.1 hypothetical protein SAMN05878426_106187 [Phaeovulum vinaykumarii]